MIGYIKSLVRCLNSLFLPSRRFSHALVEKFHRHVLCPAIAPDHFWSYQCHPAAAAHFPTAAAAGSGSVPAATAAAERRRSRPPICCLQLTASNVGNDGQQWLVAARAFPASPLLHGATAERRRGALDTASSGTHTRRVSPFVAGEAAHHCCRRNCAYSAEHCRHGQSGLQTGPQDHRFARQECRV
jgi:hypothetical protein